MKRRQSLIAFLWGVAEGWFFFMVPDVFLFLTSVQQGRPAWRAFASSVAGSLLAAVVLYGAIVLAAFPAREFLLVQPGVAPGMFTFAETAYAQHSLPPWVIASAGVPYRVYTEVFAVAGMSFGVFLLVTMAARLLRIGVPFLALAVVMRVFRTSIQAHPRVWLAVTVVSWILFYGYWFWYITKTF
jgi:hypothetical protein